MNKAVPWLIGALVLVGAVATFTGVGGGGSPGGQTAGAPAAGAPAAGKEAPGFSLPNYQGGEPVKLADYQGKVVLVNFWATWCPPCREEIPDFVRVQNELRPKGFEIVGISLGAGGAKDVAPFAKEMGINYAVALGNDQVVADYGGIRGIPTSFLLDREGKVVATYTGMVDEQTLRSAVQPLL